MLATTVDTLQGLDDEDPTERFRELEFERRRVESEMAAVVAEADRRGVHTVDGHRSIKGWMLANANWSSSRATRVRRLARARANPRCGDRLADSIDQLLEHAEHLPFDDSRVCVRRWETMADLDGAHRAGWRTSRS